MKKVCEILGKDYLNFLEGKKIHGTIRKSHLTFSKKMTPRKANLIMWVIHDGSLPSSKHSVIIYQKTRKTLVNLIDDFSLEFSIPKESFRIYKKRDSHYLIINCVPLYFILHEFYKIPRGKKSSIVEIPDEIMTSEKKDILSSTIAGSIDTDGTIGLSSSSGIHYPLISVASSSKKIIDQLSSILTILGVNHRRSSTKKMIYSVIVSKFSDALKLIHIIRPYLIEKKKNTDKIMTLSESKYRKIMRQIMNKKKASKITRNMKNRLGSYPKVASWLKENGYTVSYKSIGRWGNGERMPPIYAIILFCKYLGEDISPLFPFYATEYMKKVSEIGHLRK